MSNSLLRTTSNQLIAWAAAVIGIVLAFNVGGSIADGNYTGVSVSIAALVLGIATLTLREYWWTLPYLAMVSGLSSSALGFNFTLTDVMTACAMTCLIAMTTLGSLHRRESVSQLGVFFFFTLAYVALHAVFFGLNNYFYGNTQFKNIAKAYYGTLFPLILILLIDRFALNKKIEGIVRAQVLIAMLFSLVALVVSFGQFTIDPLANPLIQFSWASYEYSGSYVRWTILPIAMLSLSMIASERNSVARALFKVASFVFISASFFGGGRGTAVMMVLFITTLFIIRKKWKELILGGWLLVVVGGVGMIVGHNLDFERKLHDMPDFLKPVQRALSIFLPSDQLDDSVLLVEGSNKWHEDLQKSAWEYANDDWQSTILGHGFKGWDDSISLDMYTYGAAYQSAVAIAIRMGASETLFYSVLPIFGWLGVILYYGFMIDLARRIHAAIPRCPRNTRARSLCDFSVSYIIVIMIVSPSSGSMPSYNMVFWMIGLVAAEPYLIKAKQRNTVPLPTIDPHQPLPQRA